MERLLGDLPDSPGRSIPGRCIGYPTTEVAPALATQSHSTWLFLFKRGLGLFIRCVATAPNCQAAHRGKLLALQMAGPSLVTTEIQWNWVGW